jgi:hypothetical protein
VLRVRGDEHAYDPNFFGFVLHKPGHDQLRLLVLYFAWGCFRYFWHGELRLACTTRLRPMGFGAVAFARFAVRLG